MLSAHRPKPELPQPLLLEATSEALCLDSVLGDLSLHHFQIESDFLGSEVAEAFEQHPTLPGVILLERGKFLGMISRQRFLEFLLRPHGLELFLSQPMRVMHSYARCRHLMLPEMTPILLGAQQALRRSPDQQAEPLIVQIDPYTYRLLNIHELNIAYWQIRGIETQVRYERTQAQMIQSEKMAGLGRLVDGVAHEILDPVGFIWGNLTHVSTYTSQLLTMMEAYEGQLPEIPPALQELQEDIELDYLKQDLPRTIESIRSGAERLKKLVTSLQNFCHIDDVYPKPADLHGCLDSILLLLKSRLTGEIEIVRNYGHLPPVSCFSGQLSQVFMNILTSAIETLLNQAIYQEWAGEFGDRHPTHPTATPTPKPQITLTTQVRSLPQSDASVSRWVSIRIADNGPALTSVQRQRILDSFSVERRAAKETSLSVSYQIVTAKHGGKLYLRSPAIATLDANPNSSAQPTLGTEFEILLPLG